MHCLSCVPRNGKYFAMLLYPKFKTVIYSSLFWTRSSLFLSKQQRERSAVEMQVIMIGDKCHFGSRQNIECKF